MVVPLEYNIGIVCCNSCAFVYVGVILCSLQLGDTWSVVKTSAGQVAKYHSSVM